MCKHTVMVKKRTKKENSRQWLAYIHTHNLIAMIILLVKHLSKLRCRDNVSHWEKSYWRLVCIEVRSSCKHAKKLTRDKWHLGSRIIKRCQQLNLVHTFETNYSILLSSPRLKIDSIKHIVEFLFTHSLVTYSIENRTF